MCLHCHEYGKQLFQDIVMHKPQIFLPHGNTVYTYILRLIIVKMLDVQEYFHSSWKLQYLKNFQGFAIFHAWS